MKLSRDKSIAIFFCACLILFAVLSFAAMAHHAGHGCVEEDCSICICLEHARYVLKAWMGLGSILAALLLAKTIVSPLSAHRFAAGRFTPVLLRVRMND